MPELSSALNTRNGTNQYMYSTAAGSSRSELPSRRATCGARRVTVPHSRARNSDETTTACVTLMRATLGLPWARWMEATTDAPTPNIRPMPMLIMKSGAVMLTAASASLPMPRPTKMPSVITKAAEKTMPSSVGSNSLRNSRGIAMLPKSISSFSSITRYLFLCRNAKVAFYPQIAHLRCPALRPRGQIHRPPGGRIRDFVLILSANTICHSWTTSN